MRAHVAAQAAGQFVGESDAVAFNRQVDVERALPQQQIAHGAADQVHAVIGRGQRLHGVEQVIQAQLRQP